MQTVILGAMPAISSEKERSNYIAIRTVTVAEAAGLLLESEEGLEEKLRALN